MLRLGRGRVTEATLAAVARRAASFDLTYGPVGITMGGDDLPAGYRHDVAAIELAGGFDRARAGLREWAAHRNAGMTVVPAVPPVEGATVAISVPIGPVTAIAVCRIVAVVDEAGRYGFAYGTLPGHPEEGEEAFVVEEVDGAVVFRIRAFSRPAELIPRLGGRVTRWVQRRATQRYLTALADFLG